MNIRPTRFIGAVSLMFAAILAACSGTETPEPPKDPVKVTLFGINDLHGNLLPPSGSVTVADPASPAGTRVSAGGVAYMATLLIFS